MEINIGDILKSLAKRWWIIVVATVLCAVGAYYISSKSVTTSYRATATILAQAQISNSGDSYSFSDLNYVHALIPTYLDIMTMDKVYDSIVASYEEEGKTITRDQLKTAFTFEQEEDSIAFKINCTAADMDSAIDLLNRFITEGTDTVNTEITTIELKIIDPPHDDKTIVSGTGTNTLLGVAAGLIVGIVIVLVINALDTGIKSPKEIVDKYDLPVVGLLPIVQNKSIGGQE